VQDLIQLHEGSDDIVIGISGFGSAKVDPSRWDSLYEMTGRTTYVLRYDAQEFPSDILLLPLIGVGPTVTKNAIELRRRWKVAREAARMTVPFLGHWVERWLRQGRKVMIVGFSLGGFVAWLSARYAVESLRGEGAENLEVVLISAAIADQVQTWRGSDRIGHLLNVYSTQDLVLKRLYPLVVGADETPAAGLGRLVIGSQPNVTSVDVTDLVGRDHLWASVHVTELTEIALGCLIGATSCEAPWQGLVAQPPGMVSRPVSTELTELQLQRLYRWCGIDAVLWEVLGKAMNGEVKAVAACVALDTWSLGLSGERLSTLMDGARAVGVLRRSTMCQVYAQRKELELSGLTRIWLSRSSPPSSSPV
jgi:pimeloyl-ACP methyl ester carboxylesterase